LIKYDTPIEVTESQYRKLMSDFAGIVAGRQENGRYFIKVWMMKYKEQIRTTIKNN
jgi:hypothetical protein